MSIEKLHLVCPKCYSANSDLMSEVNEKHTCTACGVSSNSADFMVSNAPNTSSLEVKFTPVKVHINGDDWILKTKTRHWESNLFFLVLSILTISFGGFLLIENSFNFVTPVLVGILFLAGAVSAWEFLVGLFRGKMKLTLVGDQLRCLKGGAPLGSSTNYKWSEVVAVEYRETESKLRVHSSVGETGEKYKDIELDLSSEEWIYIQKFISVKLNQRHK